MIFACDAQMRETRVADLAFQVESAAPVRHAMAPLLAFTLRVDVQPAGGDDGCVRIGAIALNCQVRIEPARRRYSAAEQARLFDLFGPPAEWGRTVQPMLWAHVPALVPQFQGSTRFELPTPCTGDMNAAAGRYFAALDEGDVPLRLLFSGTMFYVNGAGMLQVNPISWEKEAEYRLPLRTWREVVDQYFPESGWLCVRRDLLDELSQYRRRHGLPTWEQAIEHLLAAPQEAGEEVAR